MDVPTLSYTDTDGQHTVKLESAATSLGRSPGQNIILLDPFVSRQHPVIVAEDSTYTVLDRGSSHGTFLNGERVEKAVLKSGDMLQLGSLEAPRLHFLVNGTSEQRPAPVTSMVTSLLSSITEFPAEGEKRPTAAREMEQLNWLLSAARQLNAGGAIEDILTTLLQLTLQLTSVERGFVFLSQGGEMKLARGLNSERPVRSRGLDHLAPRHPEGHRERCEVLHQRHLV